MDRASVGPYPASRKNHIPSSRTFLFLKLKGETEFRLFSDRLQPVSDRTYTETARRFVNDIAWAKKSDGTIVLVKKNGAELELNRSYQTVTDFNGRSAGVRAVKLIEIKKRQVAHKLLRLIDANGNVVIPPQNDYLCDVGAGCFSVEKKPAKVRQKKTERSLSSQARYGLIDYRGQEILPLAYEDLIVKFVEIKKRQVEIKLWGLIDANGNEVIPPQYDYLCAVGAGCFIVGKNPAKVRQKKSERSLSSQTRYGLIDDRGQEMSWRAKN